MYVHVRCRGTGWGRDRVTGKAWLFGWALRRREFTSTTKSSCIVASSALVPYRTLVIEVEDPADITREKQVEQENKVVMRTRNLE